MHHELSALPNVNLLTISAERRIYEGFPAEGLCGEVDGIDGTYELISDVIVEFTPEGDIVAECPLADYLDPTGEYLTVSVRHLDAVLQIERATGDLVWRFGPGGDFAIDDPGKAFIVYRSERIAFFYPE
jgi:hypothetical protein